MEKHHDKHSKRQRQDGGVCRTDEQRPADGQTATTDSVYDSLAGDAWFPALYADDLVDDDVKIYEP